jgi:hypothetical protein
MRVRSQRKGKARTVVDVQEKNNATRVQMGKGKCREEAALRGGGAERSKGNKPSQEEGEEGAAQCRQRSFLTMVV